MARDGHLSLFSVLVAAALLLTSCDKQPNSNRNLTLDSYAAMSNTAYVVDGDSVAAMLRVMATADRVTMTADRYTRNYYLQGNAPLWVSYAGVSHGADSVVYNIMYARASGLRGELFAEEQIRADLARLRQLRFDPANTISTVVARLEYNLTKAYLRCASIQHFGLVNPSTLLNRLEVKDSTGRRANYQRLYDIATHRPDSAFFSQTLQAVTGDSLAAYMRTIMPRGHLYTMLTAQLATTTDSHERQTLICNIERCRWRHDDYPWCHDRYVEVNLPAFTLYGVGGDSLLTMNIICGATKTKTPLLTSVIRRIDLNPRWIVPTSIAKAYVHDTAYLRRNNMYIYDKQHGRLGTDHGSLDRVMSHEQYIVQESGDANSLGRIIFRIDNNFAVYLHHTSSPHLFQRTVRAMSHGCIRLERPMDLVRFIVSDSDMTDRIEYSMTVDLDAKTGSSKPDSRRMVNSVAVEPTMPLFISYYTAYAPPGGDLHYYADIYGYDAPLLQALAPYIR